MNAPSLLSVTVGIVAIAFCSPAPVIADEREELEERLADVQSQIDAFEDRDEEPPDELIHLEERLEARLDRREVQEEREYIREKLRDLREIIERHEREGEEPPDELVEDVEALEDELKELEEFEGEREGKEGEMERALDLLSELNPPEAERLRMLREEKSERFHEVMRDLLPRLHELQELRREDPEMFEHEIRSHRLQFACDQLAERVRRARGEERAEAVEMLRNELRELFQVRLALRKLQIARIERELEELRSQVDKMSSQSEPMIERRLQVLIGGDEEW